MKKINILGALLLSATLLTGCESFLDKEFDSSLSDSKVFSSPSLTREFLTNIYVSLPDGLTPFTDAQFTGASRDVLTDNGQTSWNLHIYNRMNLDAFTSSDNPMAGMWSNNFAAIRKCNMFLENCDKSGISNAVVNGDDNKLLDRYKAEARMMRALFHFELVKYFGDAPIVTSVFDMSNSAAMNVKRTSAAEVLKWIADECDAVKDVLPFRYASEGNWGRISGATAYALKSRALLYRASDFYNTGKNAQFWADAAQASKEFMDKNSTSAIPFALYTAKASQSYGELFYMVPYQNNEFIMTRSIWNTYAIEQLLMPSGFAGCSGRTNPTQNFVDCFEMSNGKAITESGSGYDPQNPYKNRDPRLTQTVFTHGSQWGYPTPRTLDMSKTGVDAATTLTGYFLKKFCNPQFNPTDARVQAHVWILFRYAEILLNYAEAKNESLSAPDISVYNAINLIRERAGMPDLPAGLTKEQMRSKIRNERRIELSFEEHRYFDVRRWRLWDTPAIAEEMLAIRKVEISGSTYTYSAPSSLLRKFTSRNYLFPIPYDQIVKAPNLGQNPGWN